MGQVIELYPIVRPKGPTPAERISAAADLSMVDKVQRWAASMARDIERFNRPLNAPVRHALMDVLEIIEPHL